jgi:hypothetical protein
MIFVHTNWRTVMKVECKLFDLKDLRESQVSFIAESFFHEANEDFDGGYMSLARGNYESAYELFIMLGGSEWYQIRARKCQERLDEIKEKNNV